MCTHSLREKELKRDWTADFQRVKLALYQLSYQFISRSEGSNLTSPGYSRFILHGRARYSKHSVECQRQSNFSLRIDWLFSLTSLYQQRLNKIPFGCEADRIELSRRDYESCPHKRKLGSTLCPLKPSMGIEPMTLWLKVRCSTELS